MFESVQERPSNRRLLVVPVAAFVVEQLYWTILPLMRWIPALYWTVDAMLFAGVAVGMFGVIRALVRTRPRGVELVWLLGALFMSLLCGLQFLALTL